MAKQIKVVKEIQDPENPEKTTTQEVIVTVDDEGYQLDDEGNKVTDDEGDFIKPEESEESKQTPPKDVIEGLDPKDFSKDENGVLYYKGTPVTDEKGVSYFNRAMEFKRKLDEGPSTPEPEPKAKGDAREALKKKHPALDDDMIDGMVEIAVAMSQQTIQPYAPVLADAYMGTQITALRASDPQFAKYETEVTELLKQFPAAAKLTVKGAKQCLENAYNIVLGRHSREIAKEAANKVKKNKKIIGENEIDRENPARKPRKPSLSPTDQDEAKRMGVSEEDYLDIKKYREQKRKERGGK